MPKPDFSKMREVMRPQPVEGMPGCVVYCDLSGLRQLSEATKITGAAALLNELLRANPDVLVEAAGRLILNPDGTRWAGSADDIPIPLFELGALFADAVNRRLFGAPLVMEGAA